MRAHTSPLARTVHIFAVGHPSSGSPAQCAAVELKGSTDCGQIAEAQLSDVMMGMYKVKSAFGVSNRNFGAYELVAVADAGGTRW